MFGERIAHGMLTMAIGMVLVLRLGAEPCICRRHFIAMTGIDGLRFTAPVRLGDTIHSVNRVAELDVKDDDARRASVRKRDPQPARADGRALDQPDARSRRRPEGA